MIVLTENECLYGSFFDGGTRNWPKTSAVVGNLRIKNAAGDVVLER